ncbi:PREDICTED: uncharacterized protein LOC109339027 [Lupinus angustifolius]|uniref:uncharacterized protein LOC109339027 n=1 Tax=Lupinus angustifolius TaxID=3871 RepID=UPI00092FA11C|nr:PREDICTED: uncharacterized protein LOC109339027 [Lupinus angustifolius]
MAFESKNKMEFINGALPKPPPNDHMYSTWKRCNNLVVLWLTRSIDPSIVQSILWMESAQEIWEDLKERYHQGDNFKISELIGEMHSIKQGSASIDKFYTQMKGNTNCYSGTDPSPDELEDPSRTGCKEDRKGKSKHWILDIGAKDHVCHTLSLYQNFKRIKPLSISLPNGYQVTANYSGTVIFSEFLYLTNVLYVPDPHSLRMIDAAELRGGLYMLTEFSKKHTTPHNVNVYTAYNDSNIWHTRLGHFFDKKLAHMQTMFTFTQCNKTVDPCEAESYTTEARDNNPAPIMPINQEDIFSYAIPEVINSPQITTNDPSPNQPSSTTETSTPLTRQSQRTRKPPNYLKDYHCTLLQQTDPPLSQIKYPISDSLSYNNLSSKHRKLSLSLTINPTPTTYAKAIKSAHWRHAIRTKLSALDNNQTWTLTQLPPKKEQ